MSKICVRCRMYPNSTMSAVMLTLAIFSRTRSREKSTWVLPCFLLISLAGCATSQVEIDSQNVEYRTLDNPVKKVTTFSDPASPWHNLYLEWEMAHDRLCRSLGNGKLARLDAHRNVIACLRQLIAHSSPPKDEELARYVLSYENLLMQTEYGAPLRAVALKYADLKTSIAETLLKTGP